MEVRAQTPGSGGASDAAVLLSPVGLLSPVLVVFFLPLVFPDAQQGLMWWETPSRPIFDSSLPLSLSCSHQVPSLHLPSLSVCPFLCLSSLSCIQGNLLPGHLLPEQSSLQADHCSAASVDPTRRPEPLKCSCHPPPHSVAPHCRITAATALSCAQANPLQPYVWVSSTPHSWHLQPLPMPSTPLWFPI